MVSEAEFGKYIRRLYPKDCQGYTDSEVGKLFKEDNPDLYNDFLRQDHSAASQSTILQKISSAIRGVFASDWQRGKSLARKELDLTLGQEISAKADLHKTTALVLEAEHHVKETPKRLRRQAKTEKLVHKKDKANQKNAIKVAKQATNNKLSIENENQRQLVGIAVEAKEKTSVIELEAEKVRSEIRVKEYREIKQVDMEVHQLETAVDMKAAIVARVAEQFEVELLTDRLFKAIDERDKLLSLPDSKSKAKKLTQFDKNIKNLQKAIDDRAQGLIQGNKRPELRGVEKGK